jgi:predicted phage tail protein
MAQTRAIDNVIKGMMPNLKRQQEGMHGYLSQLSRRMGTAGAMQQASKAVAPFAERGAEKAGNLSLSAAQLDERTRQFNEKLEQQQSQFEQGQTNWQSAFDQRNRDQAIANAMSMYQQTGVMTQEMMELLGFGDATRGSQRDVSSQLDILGIGGSGRQNDPNNPGVRFLGDQSYTVGPNHPLYGMK